MEKKKEMSESKVIYSLILPHHSDEKKFEVHVANVCSILENHVPNCYEIVAIEGKGSDVPSNEWDNVKGEVLVIIDGDLSSKPTVLSDVITSFKEGSDMAFAGQYKEGQKDAIDPELSYFGIRRSSLSRIHESPEGYKLILEILGPETIKKLSNDPSEISGHYILNHLKKMVGKG